VVSLACGGCRYCRAHKIRAYSNPFPLPNPAWRLEKFLVGDELARILGKGNCLAVYYEISADAADWKLQRDSLILWFIRQKVMNVVAPPEILRDVTQELSNTPETLAFLFSRNDSLRMPPVPTLIFHQVGELLPPYYLSFTKEKIVRVLLLPSNTPDPIRRDRKFSDAFSCRSFKFDELLTLLGI